MQDELIDIVNEQDQVIGVIKRAEPEFMATRYTRIVLAFVVNKEGKLGMFRRTATKAVSPLHLALVGGCVQSGEDYETAAKREISEEINLNIDEHGFHLLGYHTPHEGWVNDKGIGYHKKIYQITLKTDDAINLNPDDFCELLWMTPQEIVQNAKSDKVAHGHEWLVKQYYL